MVTERLKRPQVDCRHKLRWLIARIVNQDRLSYPEFFVANQQVGFGDLCQVPDSIDYMRATRCPCTQRSRQVVIQLGRFRELAADQRGVIQDLDDGLVDLDRRLQCTRVRRDVECPGPGFKSFNNGDQLVVLDNVADLLNDSLHHWLKGPVKIAELHLQMYQARGFVL